MSGLVVALVPAYNEEHYVASVLVYLLKRTLTYICLRRYEKRVTTS